MIAFRTMMFEDIPSGLKLCRDAGWNQLSSDWELFLNLNPTGCAVCVDGSEQVVGTVTTINYEDDFSWIGMVLVDPRYRKKGIGTGLLKHALQILEHIDTIRLDATPAGREVYRKLGFVDEYPLTRLHLKIDGPLRSVDSRARPLLPVDFSKILATDKYIFGSKREKLLHLIYASAPHLAWVVETTTHVQGYCFGRPGYNYTHIGPVVAEDLSAAETLLATALSNCATGGVIIDASHHDPMWIQHLVKLGFREQRPFIRMYRGSNKVKGRPEKYFSILGPEFG